MFTKIVSGVLVVICLFSFICVNGCRHRVRYIDETSFFYKEKYDPETGKPIEKDPHHSRAVNEETTDKVGWGLGS